MVDAVVHDLLDRAAFAASEAFANSVVDDDRVVNGITGDREDRADHRQRQLAPEQREHADCDDDIVQERDDRAHRE